MAALPPLLGIPVALKDLVVTRGRPSTAGSRILEGFVGPYDADIAERLVISEATAARHVFNIFTKLGVHTRAQAVAVAMSPPGVDR